MCIGLALMTLSTLNCLFKCVFSPFSSNNFPHVNHHVYIILLWYLLANLSTTILLSWNNNRHTYQSYTYSSAKSLPGYYITMITLCAVSTNNQWSRIQLQNNTAMLLILIPRPPALPQPESKTANTNKIHQNYNTTELKYVQVVVF